MLMKLLQYPNPLIANAHKLTSITSKIDPGSKVYFFTAFLKPGRHMYVVKYDNQSLRVGEAMPESNRTAAALLGMPQLRRSNKNFFVYEMLAVARNDTIPAFHKMKHVDASTTNKYVPRRIFRSMNEEIDQSIR